MQHVSLNSRLQVPGVWMLCCKACMGLKQHTAAEGQYRQSMLSTQVYLCCRFAANISSLLLLLFCLFPYRVLVVILVLCGCSCVALVTWQPASRSRRTCKRHWIPWNCDSVGGLLRQFGRTAHDACLMRMSARHMYGVSSASLCTERMCDQLATCRVCKAVYCIEWCVSGCTKWCRCMILDVARRRWKCKLVCTSNMHVFKWGGLMQTAPHGASWVSGVPGQRRSLCPCTFEGC